MSKPLATRSHAVAERISTLTPFSTYGAMGAAFSFYSSGWLRGDGQAAWYRDVYTVDYVVFSYGTPIAWHTPESGWVVVDRAFSVTSGRHQTNAKWGVQMSDDKRVERVMIDYRLTDAQSTLLYSLYLKNDGAIVPVAGQSKRSARILNDKGLVAFDGNLIMISDNGKKVFAR